MLRVHVQANGCPDSVYDAAMDSFNTHVSMAGLTGLSQAEKGKTPHRQSECRYIQKTRRHVPQIFYDLSDMVKDYGYYIPEIIQITTYNVGDYYKWHQDGSGRGYRKLSLTIPLNSPTEYDGGELEFEDVDIPTMATEARTVILFDPNLYHQVNPITRGVRHSLVTWYVDRK